MSEYTNYLSVQFQFLYFSIQNQSNLTINNIFLGSSFCVQYKDQTCSLTVFLAWKCDQMIIVFLSNNGKRIYFHCLALAFQFYYKLCFSHYTKTIIIAGKATVTFCVVLFLFLRWRAQRCLWAIMRIVTSVTMSTVKSRCRFRSHAWSSGVKMRYKRKE